MNKDLKYIQSIVKREIETWSYYTKETINTYGKEKFIQDSSKNVLESIRFCGEDKTEEVVLKWLDIYARCELPCHLYYWRNKCWETEKELKEYEERKEELIQQIEYWKFKYYDLEKSFR